jgi:hypothetical protein
MWNLKCPGKVKQFLWRFTHNSLAVRRNLSRRGVEIENTACVMLEDGSHLFLKCKYVKRLWRELCLEDQRSAMAGKPSAKEVTAYILQLYGNLQLKVVLTMWLWWNERNGVREGERRRTPADLAFVVQKNVQDFLELHNQPTGGPSTKQTRWHKPSQGWLKLNSDGTFHAERGEGGWGYVIRDEDGDVIAAGAGFLSHVRDAFQAEVQACFRGVQEAAERGMNRIVLETDSLSQKLALENDAFRLAEAGGRIYELKNLAMGSFNNYVCSFVPRDCNKVAHTLASEGFLCTPGDDKRWDVTPTYVADLVDSETAVPLS